MGANLIECRLIFQKTEEDFEGEPHAEGELGAERVHDPAEDEGGGQAPPVGHRDRFCKWERVATDLIKCVVGGTPE